jgi:hypothetical protein
VIGLTDDDALVTFDIATPGGVSDALPVTGLDGDEDLVGAVTTRDAAGDPGTDSDRTRVARG